MISKIKSLSAREQNAIADLLSEELAWRKSYARSRQLSSLAAEALAEYRS